MFSAFCLLLTQEIVDGMLHAWSWLASAIRNALCEKLVMFHPMSNEVTHSIAANR